MKTELAPIALFVYNRPWHTQQTVEALQRNELSKESDIFIFSDGPKDKKTEESVSRVRDYIKKINRFKSINIILRDANFGLAKSIIEGTTEIVNRYGKIIVMEDDLVSSPYFLKFMDEALNFYENEVKVISIHGYCYPVKYDQYKLFFLKDPGCLGWATWKWGWDIFEKDGKKLLEELKMCNLIRVFDYNNSYGYTKMLQDQIDGKNDSWAVRWYASAFLNDKLTLYPGRSLIWHIGNDDSGINFGKSNVLDCEIASHPIDIIDIPVVEDLMMRKKIEDYFRSIRPPFLSRLKRRALEVLEIK